MERSAVAEQEGRSPWSFLTSSEKMLLLHRERLLPTLPPEARAVLREVARRMVAAPETVRIIKAATLLAYVGHREDADLLVGHKPQDEVLGRVYEEAVEVLRKLPHD